MSKLRRHGLMLALSSPSGAGKTTISRELLVQDDSLRLSISVTTRPRRPGERSGRDYVFVDPDEFETMVEKGDLLEHATVFGHRYGTPRGFVEDQLGAGCDLLFDIDWQGVQQLKELKRMDLVSVFIFPPSTAALLDRLRERAQDSEEVVQDRMSRAPEEMIHWPEYDYIIVNNSIADSVARVKSILTAERHRRERQIGLSDFVRHLSEAG